MRISGTVTIAARNYIQDFEANMQEVIIICQREHLHPLIDALQQEFDVLDALKGLGYSPKKSHSSIVLEWDGTIKPEFENYLKRCPRVLDFYISTCPVEEECQDIVSIPIPIAI